MAAPEIDPNELSFDSILIRQSDRGYNLMPLEEFLALPVDRRIDLIMDRRIRFVRGDDEVSPYTALQSLDRHRRHRARSS